MRGLTSTIIGAVVLESAVIAVFGSLLGVIIGWIGTVAVNAHYQALYRTPLRFAIATPALAAFALAVAVVLGIAAGALAARRLTRAPPLELLGR